MTKIAFISFMVLAACCVQADEKGTELQIKLQAAMLDFTDSVLVDGAYSYVDTKADKLTTVYPTNMHPYVIPIGDDYLVCSEMIDETGNRITADYLVRHIDDRYRVVQMILDDRDSVKGAIAKIKK